jgi:probable phosphoglycerate mutase
MHLYFVRHGQSLINLEEWKDGNMDVGLTDLGRQQAAALARWLPQTLPEIAVLYSSTMRRARETAEVLADAYRCAVRYDDRLREIGNNRLDHTPWSDDELPQEYAPYWSSERPFASVVSLSEEGETLMHFRTRVGSFIEDVVEQYRDQVVVAVCHGGVIDVVFDHVFNIGPWRRCEVWSHNTGITHLEYVAHPKRETWRLRYHSRVDHLSDLEPTGGFRREEE